MKNKINESHPTGNNEPIKISFALDEQLPIHGAHGTTIDQVANSIASMRNSILSEFNATWVLNSNIKHLSGWYVAARHAIDIFVFTDMCAADYTHMGVLLQLLQWPNETNPFCLDIWSSFI